jgi:hypothetical protein
VFSAALITREHIACSRIPTDPPQAPASAKLALIDARRESTELSTESTESTLFLIGRGWRAPARLPPALLFRAGRTRGERRLRLAVTTVTFVLG